MSKNVKINRRGFTLIELMVSVSIFAIVALIVSGAVITANRINEKAQAIKVVMDSLHFALNSMVFKMQEGGNYRCPESSTNFLKEGLNCSNEDSIAFTSEDEKIRYLYRLRQADGRGYIEVMVDDQDNPDDGDFIPITSTKILDIQELGFYVSNYPAPGDVGEATPYVFIVVKGEGGREDLKTSFAIETSVSER